jgi:hypothetical protein
MPVTIVRNWLIEHSDKIKDNVYGFGFGLNGPVVRPVRPVERTQEDPGLVPNTRAFVDALHKIFRPD